MKSRSVLVRILLALGVVVVASLVAVMPAEASFPGTNGRIVFQSTRHGGVPELYSMNPDATDVRRLTWNDATDRMPRVSRDGSRIVFASDRAGGGNFDVYVMDAAGGDVRRLTTDARRDDQPVFTADGQHVVFQRTAVGAFGCPCELRIVAVDGTGERRLDTGPIDSLLPDMSPRGSKLAFTGLLGGVSGIYVMQLDRGDPRRVTGTPPGSADFRPRWSPRGNDLVFMRDDGVNLNDIYTVHADGTDLRQLTNGTRFEEQAQWSPDGERIVFAVFDVGAPFGARLYTIDADDGSDERVLPQAVEVADSFDGPGLDSSTWWQNLNGPGSALAVVGGRVETSLAADAANGASGFMGPVFGNQCRAVGDYDARVRYELLDWPFSNGVHVLLGDGGLTGSIGRRSESGFEDYLAFFNPVPASALTTHTTGELRLARTGPTLTAYFREGDAWVPLLSGPAAPGPVTSTAHLFSTDSIFGNAFVRVAYDDFRIEATAFECPSWWRDSGPDWAVG